MKINKKFLSLTVLILVIYSYAVYAADTTPGSQQATDTAERATLQKINADKNFRSGYYHFQRQEFKEAEKFLNNSLDIFPAQPYVRYLYGKTLAHNGDFERAGAVFSDMKKEESDDTYPLKSRLTELQAFSGDTPQQKIPRKLIRVKSIEGKKWDVSRFINPTQILLTDDFHLLIAGFNSNAIVEMNLNGKYLNRISASKPFGLALDKYENLYYSEFALDRVVKLGRNGKLHFTIGKTGTQPGDMLGPKGIFVDLEGYIYVVDSGNSRIQKFNPGGQLILYFGVLGTGNGEFLNPTSIFVDGRNYIYVADSGNHRLQKFDSVGNWLYTYPLPGNETPRSIVPLDRDFAVIATEEGSLFPFNFLSGFKEPISVIDDIKKKPLKVNFFDLVLTPNRIFYALDNNKSIVQVLKPSEELPDRFFVNIVSSHSSNFPLVYHRISVTEPNGYGIAGLTGRNFFVYENKVPIFPIKIKSLRQNSHNLHLVWAVDKRKKNSRWVKVLKNSSESLLRRLRELLPGGEKIDQSVWISRDTVENPVHFTDVDKDALLAISSTEYQDGDSLFVCLEKSMGDILSLDGKRFFILVYTEETEKFLEKHIVLFRRWLKKMRIEQIPMAIAVLDNKEPGRTFKNIFKGLGYNIYQVDRVSERRRLAEDIKNTRQEEYLLVYRSPFTSAYEAAWIKLKVVVDLFRHGPKDPLNFFGYDLEGYYVP